MYESPIDIIHEKMVTEFENNVYKAVLKQGVVVDKDELIKALQYDRGQYEKGYADGLRHSATAWISVEERLPESNKIVLVSAVTKCLRYRHTLMVAHIGHHEFTTEDTDWREYEGDTEYDEENDCFWIPQCWYEVNAVEDNGNWIIDSDYEVTHWMPLPEPPKGE